jgi:hypothetical protein
MRRKPELSDSTLRWKGTEPTASTVKNKNRKQLTENVRETPTLIGSRTIILHDFTQFLRHGSARISFEKKKYSHFARLKEMHLHTRRDHETN